MRKPVACFLLAMAACLAASAQTASSPAWQTVPVPNAGFQQWDTARGLPADWGGSLSGYTAQADCEAAREGRCALRLASTSARKEKEFAVLSQGLPLQTAAGHRVKLAGWLRTETVEQGWAGLWARVDGKQKVLAFDNMQRTGPRGSTGWQRVEIELPVAANAGAVTIGVLLVGTGSAWVDDVRVSVDTASEVPSVELPRVNVPPRPQPSQVLLMDAELALPAAAVPAVPDAWRADVLARHHAIRSLFSDDFSDLQFLKPLLANRRVVQLGESGHGVAEFSWMKLRVIKFLHQQLGYDVLAFESSLTSCDEANSAVGLSTPADVMNSCIFGVWRTQEVLPLFSYLEQARAGGHPLTLAGFDPQISVANYSAIGANFRDMLALVAPEQVDTMLKNEKLLRPFKKDNAPALAAYYGELAQTLQANRENLRAHFAQAPQRVDLAIQEAKSRVAYVRQLEFLPGGGGIPVRDAGMADNLDFLLDRMYPGRKLIVWAHNFHIAYQNEAQPNVKQMGVWVAERRRQEVYTIGLYMGRGAAATNGREVYQIADPAANTLEAVLANTGRSMSFVDVSRWRPGTAPAGWAFQSLPARDWGITPTSLTPAKTYDAVIYIDTVTPPVYR